MKLLAIILLSVVLLSACQTQSAAPAIKTDNLKINASVELETPIKEVATTLDIDAPINKPEPEELAEVSNEIVFYKKEIKEFESAAKMEATLNNIIKAERKPNTKAKRAALKNYSVLYNKQSVSINDVVFNLANAHIEKMDKTTEEAQILCEIATKENAYFKSNIDFRAKNVSRRFMGKYEYELFIKNQNRVLSLNQIALQIDFLGKENADLGSTRIIRNVNLMPGESARIDWAVDWAFLEDGTRKCAFTITNLENNIESFRVVVDVN